MATRIIIKHRSVTGTPPSASDLAVGELALNTADGTMFTKHTDNSIVVLGGTGEHSISNNAITLPKLQNAARGSLITFDENQNAIHFPIGTAGQVLKSDGNDILWGAAGAASVSLEDSSSNASFVVSQIADGTLQRSTAFRFTPSTSALSFKDTTSFIGDSSTTGNNLTLGNSATITLESPTIDLNASTGLDLSGAQLATNWTVATDKKIQFRNTSTYINSSTTNTLDIVSSSVAITGNLSVSGTLNAAASQVVLTATNNTNANHFIPFVDTATGNENIITDNNFTYNPSTGTLTTTSYVGNMVGNLTGNLTGNVLGKIGNTTPDTGDFTTITSSGTTTATGGFIGNLTGAATQITLDAASAGNPHFITLVDTISGNRAPRTTSGLTFNPSTMLLTIRDSDLSIGSSLDGGLDIIADEKINISASATGTINVTGDVLPTVNASASAGFNLGSATKKWKGLFVSGDTINLGDTQLKATGGGIEASGLTVTTGAVTINTSLSGTIYDYSAGTRATSRGDATTVGTFNWYQIENDHVGSLPTASLILDDSKNLIVSNNATISGTSTLTGAVTASATLDVTGATTFSDTFVTTGSSNTLSGTLTVGGLTTINNNASITGTLGVTGSSTLTTLSATNTNITGTLDTTGNTTVGGILNVAGSASLSGTLAVTGITNLTTDLNINTNKFTIAGSSGNTEIAGTLNVTGASTLTTLSATNTSINGTLGVTGITTLSDNATIGGTLGVTGVTTLATNATVGGTLGVTGTSTLAGLNAQATTTTTLAASGNATVGGTLGVTGTSTLAGLNAQATTVTSLEAQNTNITGTLAVSGTTTLAGNLVVNGSTITANSTTVTIDDPVFTLAGDAAHTFNDAKDRGIEFRWHDGTDAKIGFFGYDNNAAKFTFIADSTNTSEVFSGNAGNVIFGNTEVTTIAASSNATIGGTFTSTGAATLSNTLTVAGITNLAADLNINTNKFTVASASGNTAIAGTLDATGATSLGNTLNVAGASTLAGLSAAATSISSTLGVVGVTTLQDAATVGGTFGVTGVATLSNNASVGGTFEVTGATTLAGLTAGATSLTSTLAVGTNATITGTLGVTGASTLAGLTAATTSITNTLGVTGATTLSDTLTVTGASTLAAVSANTLTLSTALPISSGGTGATTVAGVLSNFGLDTAILDADFTTSGLMLTDGNGVYSTVVNNTGNWNAAHAWGNHALAGYLTSETSHADLLVDGDFTSSGLMRRGNAPGSYTIVADNSTNWNTAFGWGNHASVGYLTAETSHADVIVDGDFTTAGLMTTDGGTSPTYTITANNSGQWNTAYSWGNHAAQGYYNHINHTHADVVVDGDFISSGLIKRGNSSGVYEIVTDNSTQWNAAYTHSQQAHAPANAITDISGQSLTSLANVQSVTSNDAGKILFYDAGNSRFDWKVDANTIYTDADADARIAAASLTNLSDVLSVSSGDNGKILYYDSSSGNFKWKTETQSAANTDSLPEGSTNLYFTNARADARVVSHTLSDLNLVDTPGSNDDNKILYYNHATTSFKWKTDTDSIYTNADADARIAAASLTTLSNVTAVSGSNNGQVLFYNGNTGNFEWKDDGGHATTSTLPEGSNLYFTNTRTDARIAASSLVSLSDVTAVTSSDDAKILYYDYNGGVNPTFKWKDDAGGHTSTSTLTEGTNLYFTNARVDARIGSISLTSLQDVIAVTSSDNGKILYYDSSSGTFKWKQDGGHTNTTTLPEGSNLYYTDTRVDTRVTALGSANWDTAYSWGDHGQANYLTSVGVLGSHVDVDFSTAPSTGQFLKYDGANWIASNLSGGGGGTSYDLKLHTSSTNDAIFRLEDANGTIDDITLIGGNFITITKNYVTNTITLSSTDTNTEYTGGAGILISGTQINADVGTTANKLVQLDANGKLPVLDGSQLTGVSITPTTYDLFASASAGVPIIRLSGSNSTNDDIKLVTTGTGLTITADTSTNTLTFASSGGGGSGSTVQVATSPPTGASVGDQYFNSNTGKLYVYYVDAEGHAGWLGVVGSGGSGGTVSVKSSNSIVGAGTLSVIDFSSDFSVAESPAKEFQIGLDLSAVGQDIIPSTTNTYDLGSSTHTFKDLYLSGSSLKLGSQTITSDATSISLPSIIKLGTGADQVTLTAASGVLGLTNTSGTTGPAWSTVTGTPTTLAGYGITDSISTFLTLTDVTASGFTGLAGRAVTVNNAESGLEFSTVFDGNYSSLVGAPTLSNYLISSTTGLTTARIPFGAATTGQYAFSDNFKFNDTSATSKDFLLNADLIITSIQSDNIARITSTDDLLISTIGNGSDLSLNAGALLKFNNMAFPSADGIASQVLTTDGAGTLSWTNASGGIQLGNLSVTTGSNNGSGALTYNAGTGVFTFTPADVSPYLASSVAAATYLASSVAATTYLASSVAATTYLPLAGGTLTGNLDLGANNLTTTGKVLFANVYSALSDLPSATTYHGMFAHVHATGKGYFAHAGSWVELANHSQLGNSANWDTAFGWGNHASVGYLTSVPAQSFASLTGKPTTISGYGITDAFDGVFASLSSKPTTISGYGITDAVSTFLGLTDAPSSYTANKYVKVNSAGNALEFGDAVSTFLTLTDVTPSSFSGQGGKFVRVNSGATGLEFATAATATALADLSDVTGSTTAGQILQVNSGGTGYEFTSSVTPNLSAISTDVLPSVDSNGTTGQSLGSASKKWKALYVSGGTINLGAGTLKASATGAIEMPEVVIKPAGSSNPVTLSASSGGTLQLPSIQIGTGSDAVSLTASGGSLQTVSTQEESSGATPAPTPSTTISDSVPSSPTAADFWFDSTNLRLFLYYNDANSSQWIEITGGGSGGSGSTGNAWAEKSAAYTAVAGDKLFVDCSSSAVTVTLPASPSMGDEVRIIDATGNASTYNITVARNNQKIEGATSDLTISTNRAAFALVYYNTAQGWLLTEK